jgi:hypothetical protein
MRGEANSPNFVLTVLRSWVGTCADVFATVTVLLVLRPLRRLLYQLTYSVTYSELHKG